MHKIGTNSNIIVRTERGLTIAGTRITLYTILDHLKDEWPPHLIQDWFNLTARQIQGVLDYIEAHQEEVEAEYQQVVKEAEETERYWREYNREHFARVTSLPPKPGQEEIRAKLKARKLKWTQSQ
jgi:uncharacterized protein (DUF433 family)